MNSELKQVGHYKLNKFILSSFDRTKTVDLRLVVYSFNIEESMSLGHIRGTAKLFESFDLVNSFPIRGEEFLEIEYEDFYGEILSHTFCVYSVSDVAYATKEHSGMMEFTLKFVSPTRMLNETIMIQRAFTPRTTNGEISTYVKSLYDEYYVSRLQEFNLTPKELEIEQTHGIVSLVVPKLNPESTMHFFARRAHSLVSKSQSFRFFETRKKFWFATNEYMSSVAIDGVGYQPGQVDPSLGQELGLKDKTLPIFRRNYLSSITPDYQVAAMEFIKTISFGSKVDSIMDLNEGAYKRATLEFDLTNGYSQTKRYDHLDYEPADHSQEYIDRVLFYEKYRYVPITTSLQTRDGSVNYSELYMAKDAHFYHYNKNKISMSIAGRNKLFAGDLITLELFEHAAKIPEKDEVRSGDYYVETIENSFIENEFTQHLILSRKQT
jgi:hypothetical protein